MRRAGGNLVASPVQMDLNTAQVATRLPIVLRPLDDRQDKHMAADHELDADAGRGNK